MHFNECMHSLRCKTLLRFMPGWITLYQCPLFSNKNFLECLTERKNGARKRVGNGMVDCLGPTTCREVGWHHEGQDKGAYWEYDTRV
jgi:hypothetical protein